MKKIIFTDVCHTLVPFNTTYEFISYFLKKKSTFKFILFQIYMLLGKLKLFFYFRYIKKDLFRILAVKFLKGFKKKELTQEAYNFWYYHLSTNSLNQIIFKKIIKNKNIYLVSASIDPPISQLGKILNVKGVYASKLIFKKSVSTGEFSDITGKKDKFISKILKKSKNRVIHFYTDNKEDINILKFCNKFYAICYSKEDLDYWDRPGIKKIWWKDVF